MMLSASFFLSSLLLLFLAFSFLFSSFIFLLFLALLFLWFQKPGKIDYIRNSWNAISHWSEGRCLKKSLNGLMNSVHLTQSLSLCFVVSCAVRVHSKSDLPISLQTTLTNTLPSRSNTSLPLFRSWSYRESAEWQQGSSQNCATGTTKQFWVLTNNTHTHTHTHTHTQT
jgi:hypothetical protein